MSAAEAIPRVSVLMAVHNGADYIRQSIASILAQSLAEIEVIVVDDCSTDETPAILARMDDPRLTVLRNPRNLGVVGARCRGVVIARAPYICVVDHDDLVFPTRFARQIAFLEAHPDVVMVGTSTHILDGNRIVSTRRPAHADPLFLRWSLNTTNPLVHSSVMFRAEALRALGGYLREEFVCAEDFDFFHRLLEVGEIACLDEPLTVYRRHGQNFSLRREAEMIEATARVLQRGYQSRLGDAAGDAAGLVVRQLFARRPAESLDDLHRLGRYLDCLRVDFITRQAASPEEAQWVNIDAAQSWWRAVRQAAHSGLGGALESYRAVPRLSRFFVPPRRERLLAGLYQVAPLSRAKPFFKRLLQSSLASVRAPGEGAGTRRSLTGIGLSPAAFDADIPPTLYVVVDTEAEFDWSLPFSRSMTSIANIAHQRDAQAIFEPLGIRPVYVVDYPVAAQPEGYGPLRDMLERRVCHIGMHLHPWTCPPFEEELNDWNSYPGNLPPDLEDRKMAALAEIIRGNFGVPPLFYKAGRYGFGPHTADMLGKYGVAVDFSLLAETDLRFCGGADCRRIPPLPHRGESGTLFLPMTRSHTGLLARAAARLSPLVSAADSAGIPLRGILSRAGLFNRITLTPEGIDLSQNIHLIRTLLRRGHRTFVMHYHSSSLVPGFTPYARNSAERDEILRRIEGICGYFMSIGGFPGDPLGLVRTRHDLCERN